MTRNWFYKKQTILYSKNHAWLDIENICRKNSRSWRLDYSFKLYAKRKFKSLYRTNRKLWFLFIAYLLLLFIYFSLRQPSHTQPISFNYKDPSRYYKYKKTLFIGLASSLPLHIHILSQTNTCQVTITCSNKFFFLSRNIDDNKISIELFI